jgi:hypothetical protein
MTSESEKRVAEPSFGISTSWYDCQTAPVSGCNTSVGPCCAAAVAGARFGRTAAAVNATMATRTFIRLLRVSESVFAKRMARAEPESL